MTIAVSGLALAAGPGAAASLSADGPQSDALSQGDSVSCEGCVCLGDLADKLDAECVQVTAAETAALSVSSPSPDCVDCVPECVRRAVETRGKDPACRA